MCYRMTSIILGTMLMGLGSAVSAQSASEEVGVTAPYVRAVPPGQPNSASFMELTNGSSQAHALVAAESPACRVAELHSHVMQDGMMSMRRVERIDLPAGETVALEPGGLHLMMIDLQQSLEPGQEIPVTLVFEDGSRKPIHAPVRKIGMHH